jgi:ABC-type nitrate/sulfonate/bicarbonate transport system permease component
MELTPLKKKQINIDKLIPVISIGMVLAIWELFVIISKVPTYVLPRFSKVIVTLFENRELLVLHSKYTVSEALIGIVISIFIAITVALIMDQFKFAKKLLYPIIAISQTIPLMAIAPLFIIWFGFDMLPKVLVVILVCFFPMTINIMTGFEEIDQDKIDLFKVMKSSKFDLYRKLKIPSAIPYFFSGLKIATTYAILAALIGEFMGGKYGLGLYLEAARRSYSIESVFAIIIVVISITLILLGIIQLIERRVLKYKGEF